MYVRGAAPIAMEGRVRSPVRVEDVRRTSPAPRTSEEVTGKALVVLAGPSTAILPRKDGSEVMALGLGLHVNSRGWTLPSFFHLVMVQGSWEVMIPWGLPLSPSRYLQDGPVPILN